MFKRLFEAKIFICLLIKLTEDEFYCIEILNDLHLYNPSKTSNRKHQIFSSEQ